MQELWSWVKKLCFTPPQKIIAIAGLVLFFVYHKRIIRLVQGQIPPSDMDPTSREDNEIGDSSANTSNEPSHEACTSEESSAVKATTEQDDLAHGSRIMTYTEDEPSTSSGPQPTLVVTDDMSIKQTSCAETDSAKTAQQDNPVNNKNSHIGQVETVDMPPKRKRRTSRDDTKTKKLKEDCRVGKSLIPCSPDDELSKPFSLRKCRSWFLQYAAQDDPETIGPDGIEKLCHDLSVDPENVVMLVVAWKLQAETLGFFKFTEWCKGMGNLECDSTAKLKARLGSLTTILKDNPTFKKVYRYAFDFCRNRDQRTLDIDTAMAMLKVLLKTKWSLLDPFLDFVQQSKYKVVNRDQWCNVLEFSRSISTDLTNYDEDGAWPVLMDEFVEWYRTNYLSKETT